MHDPSAVAPVSNLLVQNWQELLFCIEDLILGDAFPDEDNIRDIHRQTMDTLVAILSFDDDLADTLFSRETTAATIADCWTVVVTCTTFPSTLFADGCVVIKALSLIISREPGFEAFEKHWGQADWGSRLALATAAARCLKIIALGVACGIALVRDALHHILTILILYEIITFDPENSGWDVIQEVKGVQAVFAALYHVSQHPSTRCYDKSQVAVLAQRALQWLSTSPTEDQVSVLKRAIHGGAVAVLVATAALSGPVVPRYDPRHFLIGLVTIRIHLEHRSIVEALRSALSGLPRPLYCGVEEDREWNWIEEAVAFEAPSSDNPLTPCFNFSVRHLLSDSSSAY